jgi:hypothetical protein
MESSQLSALLNELLQPDTDRVKAAEGMLKAYLKSPSSMGGLLEQIQVMPCSHATLHVLIFYSPIKGEPESRNSPDCCSRLA